MKRIKITIALSVLLIFVSGRVSAQFLMDMVDTTKNEGRGLLSLYKKFDNLKIGGYIQPQFQIAADQGIKSYEGGDFGTQVSNRFMLRRSRIRIDYAHFDQHKGPGIQIVFQFDANERGFTVRDVWGRIFENHLKLFSFTTGIFARPFGFEINYSSSDRESPERGRMSQILMKGERDLGAMVSFDPRRDIGILSKLKIDAGIFDGQGITATGDFDNFKDLIVRAAIKQFPLSKRSALALGLSTLQGGLVQNTRYRYFTGINNGTMTTLVDSSASNLFGKSPRQYYGVDGQLRIKNRIGYTELRAELVSGRQTGTATSSETPVTLQTGNDGFYVRKFSGAYFYWVQHLFSTRHQLVVKYDWYDPNSEVGGKALGATGSNLSAANIRYDTVGIGYVNYLTENVKLTLYYAHVWNEHTQLKGYTSDVKDDVMTFRVQYRF